MSRLKVGNIYQSEFADRKFFFLYKGTLNSVDLDTPYLILRVLNVDDKETNSLKKADDAGVVQVLPQLGFGKRSYSAFIKKKDFNKRYSNYIVVSDKERTLLMLKGLV